MLDITTTGQDLTIDDVRTAHARIKPYIHKTPVLTSSYLNGLTGAELFFKCENFQKAGAFKVRGASNAVFGLSDEVAGPLWSSLRRGLAAALAGSEDAEITAFPQRISGFY